MDWTWLVQNVVHGLLQPIFVLLKVVVEFDFFVNYPSMGTENKREIFYQFISKFELVSKMFFIPPANFIVWNIYMGLAKSFFDSVNINIFY